MIPYENWHIGSTLPNPPTAKERRHGRLVLLLTAAVFLALAFGFAGCKTSQPDARHNATILAPPVGVNSYTDASTTPTKIGVNAPEAGAKTALNPQKKPIRGASLRSTKSGILSGIGSLFSTPEGRAHRHAVKLARASAPHVGKKAQATLITGNNNAVKQASSLKGQPATNADTGAVVTNTSIGKNKASAATAPGATATTTVEKPGFPWWIVVVGAGVGVWVFRKSIPFIG